MRGWKKVSYVCWELNSSLLKMFLTSEPSFQHLILFLMVIYFVYRLVLIFTIATVQLISLLGQSGERWGLSGLKVTEYALLRHVLGLKI